mmetsp:Transcript_48401/g.109049  ORF Transcript_48401/g.109049 Transcript_48401/m.109049 type:complete len:221 (+) Transcript_48401:285-947(+)
MPAHHPSIMIPRTIVSIIPDHEASPNVVQCTMRCRPPAHVRPRLCADTKHTSLASGVKAARPRATVLHGCSQPRTRSTTILLQVLPGKCPPHPMRPGRCPHSDSARPEDHVPWAAPPTITRPVSRPERRKARRGGSSPPHLPPWAFRRQQRPEPQCAAARRCRRIALESERIGSTSCQCCYRGGSGRCSAAGAVHTARGRAPPGGRTRSRTGACRWRTGP